MRKIKINRSLPINAIMIVSYLLLVIYAYMQANRIINNIVILMSLIILVDGMYFFLAISKIEAKVSMEQAVEKYDSFTLKVQVINHAMIPSPYIYLIPQKGKRSKLKSVHIIGVMLKHKETATCTVLYEANLCGLETLALEKMVYKSFFSFFKKEIHLSERANISVLPSVMQLREMNNFTEFISSLSMQEGVNMEMSSTTIGEEEVGYELRPYVEGDSQRLIHWKIAAYRGEILVRQREKSSDIRNDVFLILNPFLSMEKEERLAIEDKLLTSFVSLVSYYLNQGESVRVAYYQHKSWKSIKIREFVQLQALKEVLGAYTFFNAEEIMNQKHILNNIMLMAKKQNGIKIIVSNYWTRDMEAYIIGMETKQVIPHIWTGSQVPEKVEEWSKLPMWHLTDQYIMTQVARTADYT